MSEADDTIRLILPRRAPAIASGPPTALPRDKPPSEQLQAGLWTRISVEKLKTQITELQGKLAGVVVQFARTPAEGMTLEEVKIGLSISIDGDIDIASAGAEASIELSYKVS